MFPPMYERRKKQRIYMKQLLSHVNMIYFYISAPAGAMGVLALVHLSIGILYRP